jgi:hypothetical protein
MNLKIKYTKPNGNEIEVNNTPEIREYAKNNGWKETNRAKPREKAEKTAPVAHEIDKETL